jgi:hypothetical protein
MRRPKSRRLQKATASERERRASRGKRVRHWGRETVTEKNFVIKKIRVIRVIRG